MNERIIMGMVAPYLKGNTLTYQEFEQIFSMLSIKEQYGVLEILDSKQIELVDSYTDEVKVKEEKPPEEISDIEEDVFELLYDDDIFSDDREDTDDQKAKSENEEHKSEYLKVRRKIHLSNRVLIGMIKEGDAQAKQDLCMKNLGLVDKWAGIYQHVYGNKMSFEDLEQAGMLGMIKAAEKFDLSSGFEFSTYAVWWIKQAITREIMDHGYTIRIPVHKMEQIQKVMRLDSKFANETIFHKRMDLISQAAGMPVPLVEECMRLFYQFIKVTSLDLPVGEDEDVTLGEMVPCERETSVEDIVSQQILRERLEELLQTLTNREQTIIRLRFGLDDGEERTLEQIGQEFGVTRERIRQIEAKALRKLRHPSRSRKIKDFLD